MGYRNEGGFGLLITGAVVLFFVCYSGFRWMLGPATCRDGWASSSIGIQGACSWHGGVDRSKDTFAFFGATGAVFAVGAGIARWARRHPGSDGGSTLCHLCGAPMRRRIAKRGKYAGRSFLGCSRFPRCRAIQPIEVTSQPNQSPSHRAS